MTESGSHLHPGQEIIGRWDGNRYVVLRELGSGGTGRVLLVENAAGKNLAMKISRDLPGITREHRTLLFLNNNRDIKNLRVLPGVYELDDYCEMGITYHYIVMDYCPGSGLQQFKGSLRPEEIASVGLMLAIFLFYLHRSGFVFGDLKPANILYDRRSRKLSVVDFGSVCPRGRVLLQYTPLYDRSSWQAGNRCGDEKYDLFALSMLLLSLHGGTSGYLKKRSITELLGKLKSLKSGNALMPVIVKGLRQEYEVLSEMAVDLWQRRGVRDQKIYSGSGHINRAVNLVGVISVFFFIVSLLFTVVK